METVEETVEWHSQWHSQWWLTWILFYKLISWEPVVLVRRLAVPMHPVLQYAVLAPVAHNAPLEHAEFDLPRASWLVMVVDGRSG